jgi:hypothetical protein
METRIDRAKGRLKAFADQIESNLRGIAYKAEVTAKTFTKIVRGILSGQHRP